jgi:guanylate kinase
MGNREWGMEIGDSWIAKATKTKAKGLIIVLSGPSGCGKTTIRNELLKKNPSLKVSISYTTRSPRPNEVNGKDYFFLSKDEFKRKIEVDQFAEWACYNSDYYGTPKAFLEKCIANGEDLILTIDTQGALNIKKLYPESVLIFIMPASLERLESQLRKRKTDSESDIQRRLEIAKKEMDSLNLYDYVVVNDKVAEAAEQVRAIIKSEGEVKISRQ